MINTFEFIDTSTWCRLASNKVDFYENKNTYLPIFEDVLISSSQDSFTSNAPAFNQTQKGIEVGGSIMAHLNEVIIKDQSLLILVSENLSITEGYGNRRWAIHQINQWPDAHNYPFCIIGSGDAHNFLSLKKRIKIYSIEKKVQRISLSAIYLSVRSDDKNIYHWLIETLIRLKCLDEIPELRKLPLIVRDPLTNFQLETLKIMGVENKIIITNGESFLIDELFFPSIPSTPSQHPAAMKWLRDKFLIGLPDLGGIKRRLFISRADSNRQVANEDEIFDYLEQQGYIKLVMSELSIMDQIDYFRSAESVVISHGAAGAYLLFAPLLCKVIELHSPKWISHCYFSLCNSLGISYRYLIGSQSGNDMDYVIDLQKLKTLL